MHLARACRFVVVAAAACASPASPPPTAQVVLHVDTDAPIAALQPTAVSTDAPIPLFDRLRFDIIPPGADQPCAGCTEDVAVSSDVFTSNRVSIGVVTPPGASGYTARVRLYVARFLPAGGEPNPDSTLDTTVALPTAGESGVVDATVLLSTDDVGQPRGSGGAPVPPVAGGPGPSLVGTWAGAARTTCAADAPPGMVCVPGGAFWMGSPGDYVVNDVPTSWHRLVVLSAFYLDATEVTVKAARAGGIDTMEVLPWGGGTDGNDSTDWCTYTVTAGPRDPLPINCVNRTGGSKYCQALGGDLPTEAQLEYVMGGLAMLPFVWGSDPPDCAEAIWGRNGYGQTANFAPNTCYAPDHFLRNLDGPEPPGHGSWDVLPLPGGSISDLIGNVSEWSRDDYQPRTEPCWSAPGVMTDPVCTHASKSLGLEGSYRGGAWDLGGVLLEAPNVDDDSVDVQLGDVGFRCMKAGS